jgi:AbrB family looped-hinge helix DNA binding protein
LERYWQIIIKIRKSQWYAHLTLVIPTHTKIYKVGISYFLTMEITKVSSKGQVVIPSKIREMLGLVEGSTVALEVVNDMAVIKKLDVDLINQFKNSLADVKLGKIRRVA